MFGLKKKKKVPLRFPTLFWTESFLAFSCIFRWELWIPINLLFALFVSLTQQYILEIYIDTYGPASVFATCNIKECWWTIICLCPSWWAFSLLPVLLCLKQCCCEHPTCTLRTVIEVELPDQKLHSLYLLIIFLER